MAKKGKSNPKKDRAARRSQKSQSDHTFLEIRDTHKKAILLIIVGVYVLFGIVNFSSELSTIGDNAQFVVLGQSLAEGQGYKMVNRPAPQGHTKYPFGFPALLAVFYHLFHLNYLGYKIVIFLFSIGTVYLLFRWLDSDRYRTYLLFAFLLLIALNLKLVEYSSLILSETPFLFFVILGFYFFREFDSSARPKHFVAGILSWGVAYYMRSIGIVLFPALFLHLLLEKRYKWTLITIFVTLAVIAPWQLWTASHGGTSYLKQIQMKNPYSPHLGNISISELLSHRIPDNFKAYFLIFIPESVITIFKMQKFAYKELLGAVLSLSVFAGFLLDFWKKWDLKGWYFLGTLAVVLLWPEVWMGERFLFGIIPLIVFYFVYFLFRVVQKITGSESGRERLFLGIAAVLALLLFNLQINFSNPQTRYSRDWINYKQAMRWLKVKAPADAVIVCRKPYLGYLWSGKKTIGVPTTSDRREVYQRFEKNGVTQVVYDGFYWTATTRRYLGPVIQDNRQDFPVIYALKNPPTYVLQFRPDFNKMDEKNQD